MVIAALVAAQSMIFGLAVSMTPPEGAARWWLHGALAASALVVFVLTAPPLIRRAWQAARRGKIVMEQLFLAGILGAFGASLHCTLTHTGDVYYEVVSILLAIYHFGQLIAGQRKQAALDAARALGAEFSTCERVEPNGELKSVPAASIQPGDKVRIPAGSAIAVDGVVLEGIAMVRQSALTGESFPVTKRPGDSVLAGSVCLDSALEVRATSPGSRRELDALLESVRSAQNHPSRIEAQSAKLASWFLPAVLLVAVLTFGYWFVRAGWQPALFNALAVLVVACPCSMGLATPVSIWAALSSLARRGLFVNDSNFVEQLAGVDVVVFDKTGTLGEDRFELLDFVCIEGCPRSDILEAVAAIEAASAHPIARAFRRNGAGLCPSTELLPGAGIRGVWSGSTWSIGNGQLLKSAHSQDAEKLRGLLKISTTGTHEVWVLKDGQPVGLGILREQLRQTTRAAIRLLQELGIRCMVMTGDRPETAEAHALGIEILAGLSPAQKENHVRSLSRQGSKVLFVGDGINDAPAMAAATASIAVGAASTLATETAQAHLISPDLTTIPSAILRAKRAVRAIQFNLLFAAAYNIVGISFAAAGLIHPVGAALLMLASSLTVTWQALREAQDLEIPSPSAKARFSAPLPSPAQRTTQRVAPVPSTAVRWQALTSAWLKGWKKPRFLPAAIAFLLAGGIVAQGIFAAWLGGLAIPAALGLALLFTAAGATLYWLIIRRPVDALSGMTLAMFSFGGLLMLVGWWADAGFGAVVRDGVCLCGCADSTMGLGLLGPWNWMTAGMILGAVPALVFEPASRWSRRITCWAVGILGMLAGMELGAWLIAQVPVSSASAGAHFFATYASMILGMTAGMLLACQFARSVLLRVPSRMDDTLATP